MLAILLLCSAHLFAAAPQPEVLILPPSIDLERKTQPWCPDDCAVATPFVANYRQGGERLVFVGARHAFEPGHATMRAVAAGFAARRPDVVIIEGFPTGLGENPVQLVEVAKLYGTPDAPEFARGEASYAASLALSQGIPFIGGEPSFAEQLAALKSEGFAEDEVAFGSLLGWYSQSLRSGDLADLSSGSLEKVYPSLSYNVAAQWRLEPPTLSQFRQRYREIYGVEISHDKDFLVHTDAVFDTTRQGELSKATTLIRDRHLWTLMVDRLERGQSVFIVFGGSHWSTLSAALERRLGKPAIRPFPR
jgi:hypothetical protein